MTMEADLSALLKGICPRVFGDFAEAGTATPYITWQGIGGESFYTLSNSPIDKRNTLMQINVWAKSRLEATTMARSVEAAIAQSAAFVAKPSGEPVSLYEGDTKLFGAVQRFEIWHTR